MAENVAFGLEMRKLREGRDRRARRGGAARWCGSRPTRERLPRQLSGGQQQRVALARALAIRPDVLLLDEPLSNLDAKLREEVRVEIRELQRQLGLTTIMVTHDQEEALTMADRLVVMAEGEIRQVGSQRDLYERPADRFVAGFVGRSTFLDGRVDAPGRVRERRRAPPRLPHRRRPRAGRAGAAARAPESLDAAGADSTTACPARWNSCPISAPCSSCMCACRRPTGVVVQIANRGEAARPDVGDTVEVGWPRDAGLVFAGQTNAGVTEERT